MPIPNALLFSLIGGILPALFWLWFWLREDKLHPEPRKAIIRTFLFGMFSVAIVLPFEKLADSWIPIPIILVISWALIEEVIKFLAVWISALRTKDYDEPIDAVMYLITGALGFAAAENSLFIINPLSDGDLLGGFVTGNLRFVGASLLHVAVAGIIGSFMAFGFYKSKKRKRLLLLSGIILAIALHTVFNLSIIDSEGSSTIMAFSAIWIIVITLLIIFEKVKKIIPTNIQK